MQKTAVARISPDSPVTDSGLMAPPSLYQSANQSSPVQPLKQASNFEGIQLSFKDYQHPEPSIIISHAKSITCLLFTQDGKYLISGSEDCSIQIYNLLFQTLEEPFLSHSSSITCLAASSTSKLLISGSLDSTIRLWSLQNHSEQKILTGHTAGIKCLAISKDDLVLASGSADSTIILWSLPEGSSIKVLTSHTGAINCLCISADDKALISGSADGTVRIWGSKTGSEGKIFKKHSGPITSMAVSQTNLVIAYYCGDSSIRIWDPLGGYEKQFSEQFLDVTCLRYTVNNRLISGSRHSTVKVWDNQGNLERSFLCHNDAVVGVAVTNDGEYVISGANDVVINSIGRDQTVIGFPQPVTNVTCLEMDISGQLFAFGSGNNVKLWRLKESNDIKILRDRDKRPIFCMALSKDSKYIATGGDGRIKIWDILLGVEHKELIGHRELVSCLEFTSNGMNLISVSADKTLRIWNLLQGIEESKIALKSEFIKSMVLAHDNSYVIGGSAEGPIYIWNMSGAIEENKFQGHTQCVNSLAISKNSTFLASGSDDSSIKIWNISQGTILNNLAKHTRSVTYITISNDDKFLASGSEDRTIRLWDISEGIELRIFTGHTGLIYKLAFSSDTKYLASASGDFSVKLFNIQSGKEQMNFPGHTGEVYRILVFKDNRYLASSSQDGTIIIWNLAEGKLEKELKGHTGDINILEMTEDGKYIISASVDGTARVWDLESLIPEYSTEKQISDKECYDIRGADYTWDIKSYTNIMNRKENEVYDSKYNRYLIIPDRINILHLAAYMNDPLLLSDALNEGCYIINSIYNESPITISLRRYSRSCLDVLLEYIVNLEKLQEMKMEYAIQTIAHDIPDIIKAGSQHLLKFLTLIFKTQDAIFMIPSCKLPIKILTPTLLSDLQYFKSKEKSTKEYLVEILISRFNWKHQKGSSDSLKLLEGIYKSPNKEIYRLQFIRSLLDIKWKELYHISLMLTCLYIINLAFLVSLIFLSPDSTSERKGCAIVFTIVNFFFLLYEIYQGLISGWRYLQDVWNYIDILRSPLCITAGMMILVGNSDQEYFNYIMIIANILCWFRGLTYFRTFKFTRIFVSMVLSAIKDTSSFFIVLFYTTLAYATIFAASSFGGDNSLKSALGDAYRLNLTDFDTTDFSSAQWVIFVIASIINCIIMLNLLISILGDSYDRVQLNMIESDYSQVLQTIIEIENLMVWNRNTGMPVYLQECRAVQNDNEEGEWEGRIRILQDRLSNIKYIIEGNSKEVDSKLARIERAQLTIEEKLNSMQENQKGIEERLGRFEEFLCKLDRRLDK